MNIVVVVLLCVMSFWFGHSVGRISTRNDVVLALVRADMTRCTAALNRIIILANFGANPVPAVVDLVCAVLSVKEEKQP